MCHLKTEPHLAGAWEASTVCSGTLEKVGQFRRAEQQCGKVLSPLECNVHVVQVDELRFGTYSCQPIAVIAVMLKERF